MKSKMFTIPVDSGRVTTLIDPAGQGHDSYYAYVKITDLPLDLPMDVNPRAQNTESRVAKQIANGLIDASDVFHILNRGITITAKSAKYDGRSGTLTLELVPGVYGLLDGGHTYAVIRKNLEAYETKSKEATKKQVEVTVTDLNSQALNEVAVEEAPSFLNAHVRIEVLTGVKDELLVDIARSRNTSAQVKDESLANLEGSFEWLKEVLGKTRFGDHVAYKENEDDNDFPIDVREIISLLTLFHPDFQESEKPPIMGYTSKGRCLDLFRKEPEKYQMLKPIIPSILELYDYVHLNFAEMYKSIGGFTGIGDDLAKPKTRGIKLAKVTGVKAVKEGFPLYYLGGKANFRFPDGWLYPVVSAHRGICSYKSVVKFKADPKKFFEQAGKNLVGMTLEASIGLGRNPNAVGKSRPHWTQLHERVINAYLKLLNVDTEQTVSL
jgi:hypothetical protein